MVAWNSVRFPTANASHRRDGRPSAAGRCSVLPWESRRKRRNVRARLRPDLAALERLEGRDLLAYTPLGFSLPGTSRCPGVHRAGASWGGPLTVTINVKNTGASTLIEPLAAAKPGVDQHGRRGRRRRSRSSPRRGSLPLDARARSRSARSTSRRSRRTAWCASSSPRRFHPAESAGRSSCRRRRQDLHIPLPDQPEPHRPGVRPARTTRQPDLAGARSSRPRSRSSRPSASTCRR